ncbi:MAG: uncharacterized protein KVP18_002386 [Porospora cf. gigantea A]|uniref:uncharacterized protein n=1 Tax=Porospora cf. gigantea A TaxID=2853593 RepID=UPI003559D73C|nr:MAG: hypothetical protein KVP18_002386 [Porospora cf. gigantea A]
MEGLLELKYLVDGQVLCSGSLDRCIDKNDPTKLNNIVYVKPVDPRLKAVRNCRKIVRSFANKKHSLPCGSLPEVDQPLQDKLWSAARGLKHKPPRRLMNRMSSQQAGDRDARIKHMLLDGRRHAGRMLQSHRGRLTAAEDISHVAPPAENVQSDSGLIGSPELAGRSNVDEKVAADRTCNSAGRTIGLGQSAPMGKVMARRAPLQEPTRDVVKVSHDRQAPADPIDEGDVRQTSTAHREVAADLIDEGDVRQTSTAHRQASADPIDEGDVRQTSTAHREVAADLIDEGDVRQTSTAHRQAPADLIDEGDVRQTSTAHRQAPADLIDVGDVRQTSTAHREVAADVRQTSTAHREVAADVRQTSTAHREAAVAETEVQTSTADQEAAEATVIQAPHEQATVTDPSHIELAAAGTAAPASTTEDYIGCKESEAPSDTDVREGYDDPLNTATTTAGSLSQVDASATAGNDARRSNSSRRRKRRRNKKSSEKSTPLQRRTPTASVTEPASPESPLLTPPVHSLTQPASPLRGGSLSPALLFGRQSPNSMRQSPHSVGPRSDDGSYTRLSTFGSYDARFHRTFFLDEEDPVLHRLYLQRKEQIERRHRQGRRLR